MSLFKNVLKTAGKVAVAAVAHGAEKAKSNLYQQASQRQVLIAGRTIQEWDQQWRYAGNLSSINLTQYMWAYTEQD